LDRDIATLAKSNTPDDWLVLFDGSIYVVADPREVNEAEGVTVIGTMGQVRESARQIERDRKARAA